MVSILARSAHLDPESIPFPDQARGGAPTSRRGRCVITASPGAALTDLLLALPAGLSPEQVGDAFDRILGGEVAEAQTVAFLYGLRVAGETPDQVQGIVEALLRAAPALPIAGPLVDIVGTGGDRTGAISISSPASVLLSACEDAVTVVKHGNRGASTPTGSADVIEAWGVPLDLAPDQVAAVAREVGITFCFAPRFHAALRHAAPARRALGIPTVMNVLGPLLNPSLPQHQLVGVADPSRIELICRTFALRGADALVVRGQDGLDKLSVSGPTDLTLVAGGALTSFTISPEDVGLTRSGLEQLRGTTPTDNARVLAEVLGGAAPGPVADAVVLNAAAAWVLVGGRHDSFVERLRERVAQAREVLASGVAGERLRAWVAAARRQPIGG